MRNLIIHGMRRNGTTVLFDAFVRDPRFTTLYEPLSAVRDEPLVGGGSGTHETDLFVAVAEARARYAAAYPERDPGLVNHGGPERPEVEVEAALPAEVEDYLRMVLEAPEPWVAKLIRTTAKIEHLARLAPESVFVWTVRDPRAVVRSYLYGRGDRTRARFPTADDVFTRSTTWDPWSSRRLSEALLRRDGRVLDPPPSDAERVLLVWGEAARTALADAPRCFGERSLVVRHEDFCADPTATFTRITDAMGTTADAEVLAWVRSVVRVPTPWELSPDPRWARLFERTGISDLVEALGYPVA